MAWDNNLEGQAFNIAASEDKIIRVLAGPGTGKTFTLMRRIARLLESGVDPVKILLVTFTRNAAQDLKNELNNLNIIEANMVNAGTLHSFCFKTLQKETVFSILGRHPRPLIQFERKILIKDIANKLETGVTEIKRNIKAFEAAWAKMQHEEPGWPTETEDRNFHDTLIEYLTFHQAMLIEEEIPETLNYFKNNPNSEKLNKYEYVFVDEYQDLNKAEQNLIDLLSKNCALMVIGDEDQSIYEHFRYAHLEGILNFLQSHTESVDYPLDICRRCPKLVVDIADKLIQVNRLRNKKHLIPFNENKQGEIYSIQWDSQREEQIGISKYIQYQFSQGIPLGEIMILCPTKQFGIGMKEAIQEIGIEAHSFFSEDFFDNDSAIMSYCLLSLMVDRNDRIAIRCYLSLGSNNQNVKPYARIYNYCHENGLDLNELLERLVNYDLKISYTNSIIQKYSDLKNILEELHSKSILEIIDFLFPENEDWSFRFRNLTSGASEHTTYEELFEMIKSNIIYQEIPNDVDYVRVMTLQKSKGLTSRIVIITSAIEGLLPKISIDLVGIKRQKLLEEQRRLFYVGITRPTDVLVISSISRIDRAIAHPLNLPIHGTYHTTRTISSSFLNQMGENFPKTLSGDSWLEQIGIRAD